VIDEAASNAKCRIQRKNARQPRRFFGIDIFVCAGQSPGALDAIARLGRRTHGLGRGVVQETAEGMATIRRPALRQIWK
jgi:hypothetical protein